MTGRMVVLILAWITVALMLVAAQTETGRFALGLLITGGNGS